jgi:hypothetical protein
MRHQPHSIALLFLLTILLFACRKDDKPRWDTDLVLPLVADELSVQDLLADSLVEVAPDSLVHLVYRSSLYSFNLVEEGIAIPDTTIEVFVSLDSLSLESTSLETRISLGNILLEIPGGPALIGLISLGLPIAIPEINDLGTGPVTIDATDFFQTATITSGFLDIEVRNELPVDLTDAVFTLTDPISGIQILEDSFDIIPVGATVMTSADLGGLTVGGLLEAELVKVSTPGTSSAIMVDTSDAAVITASVRDLEVVEATAIFPAQDLVSRNEDVIYDLQGPEVTWMRIREGKVKIFIVNTIGDSIFVDYRIPAAVGPMGEEVFINTVVPPAPIGGSEIVDQEFDLAGYSIDLTGSSGNDVNTFYNEFTARIDSTGNVVTISLEDSIQVIYGLEGIIPEAIRGYAGQDQLEVSETSSFDFISSVANGSIALAEMQVDLNVHNQIGVDGRVVLSELKAINSGTGEEQTLSAGSLIGVPIDIPRALENPLIPGVINIELDEENSNIVDLIEILPDQIAVEADIDINPNGNAFGWQDFVFYDKGLDVNLDIDIPLNFSAEGVVLIDTIAFDLFAGDENLATVNTAQLVVEADNEFPLAASLKVDFMNNLNEIIYTLIEGELIPAAPLDENCRTTIPAPYDLILDLSEEQVDIISEANRIIVRAEMETVSSSFCGDYVKIYSDYELKFLLSGRFDLSVTADF